MAEEYTTIRVKKATREIIRAAESKYEKAPAEALEILLQAVTAVDNTKQILLTVDKSRYDAMAEMVKVLYGMKVIPFPTMDCMADFAISKIMEGLQKQLAAPAAVR